MITIDYNDTDYAKLLGNIAQKMNAKLKNDTLIIPEDIGCGYFKYFTMANGLQCMLSDYTLNSDVYIQRLRTSMPLGVAFASCTAKSGAL